MSDGKALDGRITALEAENTALKTEVQQLKELLVAAEARMDALEGKPPAGNAAGSAAAKDKKEGAAESAKAPEMAEPIELCVRVEPAGASTSLEEVAKTLRSIVHKAVFWGEGQEESPSQDEASRWLQLRCTLDKAVVDEAWLTSQVKFFDDVVSSVEVSVAPK